MGVRRHNGGLCGTLWGTYNDFWQDTSISAVSNAGKAKTSPYIRRFVWLILFIFFFGLTIKNVVDLTYEYRNYPVTYSVYVENEKKVNPRLWMPSTETSFMDPFDGFCSPFGYRAAFGAYCSTFRYREELVLLTNNKDT